MKFYSTRDKRNVKTLSEAILSGLAADGGLFVPEYFPVIDWRKFDSDLSYPEFATLILAEYFKDDELAPQLPDICKRAFNFKLPLQQLDSNTWVMELFHGPTLSFKDFGARFLAQCMSKLASDKPTTIMVATSGDTGSAVASAFYRQPNINVVVLFPRGKISKRQEQQITCWGDNVLSIAINGTFDDCQKIVKEAFNHAGFSHTHLSSANSINIGRLLPQITYYAYSSVQFFLAHKQAVGYIIPTGNVGNATGAYWAREMGFPIREIALATNANRAIADYIATGRFEPRASIATIANAMDVGNPSNFERLRHLYPTAEAFNANVVATSVDDNAIRGTIAEVYANYDYIVCPHTATAYFARKNLNAKPWIITATANPCKFETIIEPIIGKQIPVAPQLQELLARPTQLIELEPDIGQVAKALA